MGETILGLSATIGGSAFSSAFFSGVCCFLGEAILGFSATAGGSSLAGL